MQNDNYNNAIKLFLSFVGVLHEVKKGTPCVETTFIRPWHSTYQQLNSFSWKSSTRFFFLQNAVQQARVS